MQKVRKLHNQDLRAEPAWRTNSGKIEYKPEEFPGSRFLRLAACNLA